MKKILLLVFMVLAVTVAYSATRTGYLIPAVLKP